MKKPVRLKLSRRKGFDLQTESWAANGLEVVNVARPGKWGNPFIVGQHGTRAECVDLFTKMLAGYICLTEGPVVDAQRNYLRMAYADLGELQGKNLACWCAGEPCHGDRSEERRVGKECR
jgi:hypothetical protein